jgi:hypothetical protein
LDLAGRGRAGKLVVPTGVVVKSHFKSSHHAIRCYIMAYHAISYHVSLDFSIKLLKSLGGKGEGGAQIRLIRPSAYAQGKTDFYHLVVVLLLVWT